MSLKTKDLKNLAVAYRTQEYGFITSVDYEYNGELLVATTDNTIIVYTLTETEVKRRTRSFEEKYVVRNGRFYGKHYILHSTKLRNDIRLFDLCTDMRHISYYKGHNDEITSICTASSYFVTASLDKAVKMWDPKRSPTEDHVHQLDFPSPPLIALSESLLLIAIAHSSSTIQIYDTRNQGSCVGNFEFGVRNDVKWTAIKFSPNDKMLMISTNQSRIIIVNPITGREMCILEGYANDKNEHIDACFSLDSNFALSGSSDGCIHVWELSSAMKKLTKKCTDSGTVYRLAFNPTSMNIASTTGENDLQLWIEKEL